MRKRIALFLLLSAACFAGNAQPHQGQIADEIALPTPTGDTLRLSSFRGKVVLLDFWASWCKPCRAANKGMAKVYSKFRDKGFEIYSISIDDEQDKWIRAIKQDKITWNQVNSKGGWYSPLVRQWGIDGIPTSFLVDKDGVLVAMDLDGKQLEETLKYMLEK